MNAAQQTSTPFTYDLVLEGFDLNEIAGLTISTGALGRPQSRGLYPTLFLNLSSDDPDALKNGAIAVQAYTGSIYPAPLAAPVTALPAESLPQRFTVPFTLVFNDPATAFTNVSADNQVFVTLTATFSSNLDWSTSFQINLVAGADPIMLTGPIQYLGTDLRVYQVFDDGSANNPFNMTFSGSATDYIINILGELNSNPASPLAGLFSQDPADGATPAAVDAAEALVSQISHFPTDQDPNGGIHPVYNFALARVTLQGETQPANDVQVFFRLFPAPSSGTYFASYDAGSAYSSQPANDPNLRIPTVGVANRQILTIPFFASPRSTISAANPDTPNVQSIQPQPGGEPVYKYFGCWLDLNQPNVSIAYQDSNGSQASILLSSAAASQHQCLVAEIHYAPLPIQPGAIPGITTNQLAQRNLAVQGGTS